MPRLPQPPHEDPEVERLRQAHRDRRAAKAKAKASAVLPSAFPFPAADQKLLQLRSELAIILEKPEEEVRLIKQKDGLYDPIDGLVIMSDKDRRHCAEDLRIICERYADMDEKLVHIQFDGQGNHSNSKGCDLPTLVEIMMLSPSRQAASIRRLAAVTLCRVLGGDTGLARQILDINRVQEHLRENEIPHPARVYGQYVEEHQQGSSDSQRHCTRMEDLDYERKKQELEDNRQMRQQELEDERQKRQLKLDDERQKRQLELTEMKDRLEVAQQARRLELEGEQHKRTISCEELTRDHLLKKAKFEADVRTALEKKEISQEAADQILGKQQRRLLLIPLGTILSNEKLAEATRVCRNFAQRFKQQYKDGFFSPKPSTDWNNGIVGGEVKWYDEDLPKIREFGGMLIAEARALPSGQRTMSFGV